MDDSHDGRRTWKLTADQWRRLAGEYEAGASAPELAGRYGLAACSVREKLDRMGVRRRPQVWPTKLTPEAVGRFLAAVRGGANMEKAREAAGFGLTQFYDWIKQARAGRGGLYAQLHDALTEALDGIDARSRAQRVYSLNEHFFAAIDDEIKAYWLGFITADGWVIGGNTAGILLQRGDRPHLQHFLDALGSNAPILDVESKGNFYRKPDGERGFIRGGPTSRAQVNSVRLAQDLIALGIHHDKSYTAEPWPGPPELMPAYFRGLVDGDGCVGQAKGRGRARPNWGVGLVGTRAIVTGFAEFVAAVAGGRARPYRMKSGIWQVTFRGGRIAKRVCAALYGGATVYLERKYDRAMRCLAVPTLRDWSGWTLEALDELREDFPSWRAVAEHLGTTRYNLVSLRKRLRVRALGG